MLSIPKPKFDSPPNTTNPMHAKCWNLPGGHKLWWRRYRDGPGEWHLDSTVTNNRDGSGGGISIQVPLGAYAPALLLYTASLLEVTK